MISDQRELTAPTQFYFENENAYHASGTRLPCTELQCSFPELYKSKR
jgi:hypothetical protein